MIKKLEHIGVYVNDMDESIKFYTEVLGLRLAARKRLDNGVELSFLSFADHPETEIELIGRGTEGMPDNGIVHHIAFTVSDIEAELERLSGLGIRLLDETPRTILGGTRIAFFFGPNGERLELFQPAQ
ncbi:VOC family protein [Paenibacillus sp. YN15]|uniref:VOC family protein n=1 Tax=Paenibacillus sp. YN15 TaxID=1742774 RepID=UPI000DCD171A|nr:VOC family protein [Paenibacillus sp. YN15]RAV04117.1 VOC family protein [Paenibacillus sp. YN15]